MPAGAEEYLAKRAEHYSYPTKTYVGSCHCQAVSYAVLCKPIEEVLLMDCACSICRGVGRSSALLADALQNGNIWIYPGRHDIVFRPSSTGQPWKPDQSLVTRYTFAKGENEHVFCKECGCQLYEAREAKEGDQFEGYEEENGANRSFGLNIAMLNEVDKYLAEEEGRKALKGLQKNEGERWSEPHYKVDV